ncbi:hypothetical protein NPIL_357571 [Nephila pilipes]|uniref:Uncharacterized protein n=1 Tax=Nephila pilipes TaxID=299642 RepID=A0A8X6N7G7_NEPPI|nr:hypothetical protein NPIL_357571 [Nephila pilipes]
MAKTESILDSSVEDTDSDEILELLEHINKRENDLNIVNSEIEIAITDPTVFDKEFKISEEYSDKITIIKFRIQNRIQKINALDNSVVEKRESRPAQFACLKLPKTILLKINIPPLSGSLGKDQVRCRSAYRFIEGRFLRPGSIHHLDQGTGFGQLCGCKIFQIFGNESALTVGSGCGANLGHHTLFLPSCGTLVLLMIAYVFNKLSDPGNLINRLRTVFFSQIGSFGFRLSGYSPRHS